MANNVFANGREIACKAGSGKVIAAFPDVCFTPPDKVPPTPPGIPVPYPVTSTASDTNKGTKKVVVSKKEVMKRDASNFKKCVGDNAAQTAKKGIINGKLGGKVIFTSWSMDVKIEGKNAVRHLDTTTSNHSSPNANAAIPWPFVDSMAMSVEQRKACKEDKEKEKAACSDYKPSKTDGLDMCQAAGLSGPITYDKDVAAQRSSKANANKCAAARRCRLLPYDAEPKDGINGCCPSQTPDHIIPKSSFFEGAVSAKEKLPGWEDYNKDKAPCMCLEGANNTHGSHGLRHAHHKAFSDATKNSLVSFSDEAKHCANGAKAVAPQCEEKCIEAQLASGHKGMGNKRKKIKHSPSGSALSKDKINQLLGTGLGGTGR